MLPIGDLAGIRTSLRQHLHSLPPTHRSPYLERHVLAKEKERLEKEIASLERRCHQRRQHLADLEVQMEALAEREEAPKADVSPRLDPERTPRQLTKMTVEY